MKRIERFNLIDRIGRELQARMTYSDIRIYLSGFGVDTKKETSSINSKWVYCKEILADESDELLLKIADELKIEHAYDESITASIFLCHSSKDKFFVRELASKLQEKGVRVWLDEAEIKVGDSLTERIGNAIDKMDYFGVVLSKHSISSQWVQRELQIAIGKELNDKKVVVLPLLLEPVEIPVFLRDKLYADFTTPELFNKTFPMLLKALGVKPSKPKPIVKPDSTPIEPIVKSLTPIQRRLAEFEDIGIIDIDINKSYNPDPRKALYNMYLNLSKAPPDEWQQIFDAERRFPRHTMWRRAWIEGANIVIYCVPEELEEYHMKDILEDVNNSNKKYREYLTNLAQKEVVEHKDLQKEQDKLKDIKRRLGFD